MVKEIWKGQEESTPVFGNSKTDVEIEYLRRRESQDVNDGNADRRDFRGMYILVRKRRRKQVQERELIEKGVAHNRIQWVVVTFIAENNLCRSLSNSIQWWIDVIDRYHTDQDTRQDRIMSEKRVRAREWRPYKS